MGRDFPSVYRREGEWPEVNPNPQDLQTTLFVPNGSITNEKVGFGIDPEKLSLIGIKVYRSTNQSIADISDVDITFDTKVFRNVVKDPGSSFTTVEAPRTGIYLIVGAIEFASNATGFRATRIMVNSTQEETDQRAAVNGAATRVLVSAVRKLTEGDDVGIQVRQNSGGPLNVTGGEDNVALSLIYLGSI